MAEEYQAVLLEKFDAANPVAGATVAKRPLAQPGSGEVLVKMRYAGVNPSDVFSLMGVYPGFTSTLPAVPGFDGMGVVEKVGDGVTNFKEGQRVTALGWRATEGSGSWQQYVTLKQELLVPVPDGVSDEAAAQFYINPITVVGLLEVTAVPKGHYLLITAAGSTLSKMLIAVAKHEGVKTIGVVRREEQVAEIKSLGADEVFCSSSGNLADSVMSVTGGQGAYAVVDSVGGDLGVDLTNSVRNGGTVYLYGLMAGLEIKASGPALLFRDVRVHGFWFGPWLESLEASARAKILEKTMALMEQGIMVPETGTVYPLQEFFAAVGESLKEARGGKVLLKMF